MATAFYTVYTWSNPSFCVVLSTSYNVSSSSDGRLWWPKFIYLCLPIYRFTLSVSCQSFSIMGRMRRLWWLRNGRSFKLYVCGTNADFLGSGGRILFWFDHCAVSSIATKRRRLRQFGHIARLPLFVLPWLMATVSISCALRTYHPLTASLVAANRWTVKRVA